MGDATLLDGVMFALPPRIDLLKPVSVSTSSRVAGRVESAYRFDDSSRWRDAAGGGCRVVRRALLPLGRESP